ncbi:MAG: ABC transporter ATP-binding protein [Bacteroidales bacterium]|jgi:ABC-2 type transport system ATP-binding protein|nr:ABC transporter ATP-binding protein [Bacteroidales bacterium]NLM93628.1 ABC transporter ATP-binding protein [Bacteroidales bacterium]
MIIIENVVFAYNRKKPLFNGLSLRLEKGNIYGLLGKNGAGKTTLLKIIAGLVFPQSGKCSLNGFESKDRIPEALEDIYILPEEFELPSIKILQYVSLNAPFYTRFDMEKFNNLIEEFQLDPQKKLNQLSYGQKKKFLLAFGLSTNARLMLMDEPTNGLDIPSKSQFRKVIAASMEADQIIIISTHQVRDLQSLIDPVIIMEDGKIIFNRGIEDISHKLLFEPQHKKEAGEKILYAEEVFGGQSAVLLNTSKRETRVDLELLFNAVISQPKAINDVFENPS